MKEKMNQYKYFIITILAIVILGAVGIGHYLHEGKQSQTVVDDDDQFNFSIDGRNYIMPSPFHSFYFLNNMNFSWKGLTEYNSTIDYNNESQTALNMGFRSADGIIMLFADEKENARKTRSIVIELAIKLDITPDIREALSALDNAVITQVEQPILTEKIIHLQNQMEKALHKKKKENLAVLVELGGWLEGLNITSKGIIKNYSPASAEILRQPHIAEIYITVLKFLSQKSQDKNEKKILDAVLEHLIKIHDVANHSHKEAFPLEKVKKLYDISTSIKKIIESKDETSKQ